ncbi:inner centromere protein-like isoform X2 [Physella acuta]|uniref:inner centromere protein-like isoform X2 n=1 Tax=Physella acuta TaxID=109671 RepID=UPI0027DCF986|nr:inner centromere protein-like isoform X2 [Physella acuta]
MMEAEYWFRNLKNSFHSLIPYGVCQNFLEKTLGEIEKEFTWLDEIVEEAYHMFSVKSTKLSQMPKTPCQKKPGQKRLRKNRVSNIEEKEEIFSPLLPKKLKLETQSPDVQIEKKPVCNTRPLRSCKSIFKATQPGSELALKQVPSPKLDKNDIISNETMTKMSGQKSKSLADNNSVDVLTTVEDLISKRLELKSPSVRERTIVFENLIKNSVTKQIVKTPKCAPPGDNVTPKACKPDSAKMKVSRVDNLVIVDPSPQKQVSRFSQLRQSARSSQGQSCQHSKEKQVRSKSHRVDSGIQSEKGSDDDTNKEKESPQIVEAKVEFKMKESPNSIYQKQPIAYERTLLTDKMDGEPEEMTSSPMNTTYHKDCFDTPQCEPKVTRSRARLEQTKSVNNQISSQNAKQLHQKRLTMDLDRPTLCSSPVQHVDSLPLPCEVEKAKTVKLTDCCSDDEVIAGSPAIQLPRSSIRPGKKRHVEERGLSPCPKRFNCGKSKPSSDTPLLSSSPIKNGGAVRNENESFLSPIQSPRAFKFSSAQKKTSGFLNRTPGFGMNTSKLYSFLNNSVNRTNGITTSFLKKSNTPKPTSQISLEQKKMLLLEKENREKEKVKKAAEMRRNRIEEKKRIRAEKERKVAEAREMKIQLEEELKEKINRKAEDKNVLTEKLMEKRLNEEKGKQKLRLKRHMDVDARRKQEEEERLKKLIEQEENTKLQEEYLQKKKKIEDVEKKRLLAEEKKKQAQRLAELETKRQEAARLLQVEKEKKDLLKVEEKDNKMKIKDSKQLDKTCAQSSKTVTSYQITPAKSKINLNEQRDPENYDIEDKVSDDSTDDEEAPKKRIPEWATGTQLNTALIKQHCNPPDLEEIFHISSIQIPNDLRVLFPGNKNKKFRPRTSSAVWTSPLLKH